MSLNALIIFLIFGDFLDSILQVGEGHPFSPSLVLPLSCSFLTLSPLQPPISCMGSPPIDSPFQLVPTDELDHSNSIPAYQHHDCLPLSILRGGGTRSFLSHPQTVAGRLPLDCTTRNRGAFCFSGRFLHLLLSRLQQPAGLVCRSFERNTVDPISNGTGANRHLRRVPRSLT